MSAENVARDNKHSAFPLTARTPFNVVHSLLNYEERGASGWHNGPCPVHEDDNPSFGYRETENGGVVVKCFACDASRADILHALKINARDVSPRGYKPALSKFTTMPKVSTHDVAEDKKLLPLYLFDLGLDDGYTWERLDKRKNRVKQTVIRIPYYLEDGTVHPKVRIRYGVKGKQSAWDESTPGTMIAYGLNMLHIAREKGYLIIVEGESDCWTLWFHGFPALGVPGANNVKVLDAAQLQGIDKIYVMREQGIAGNAFYPKVYLRLKETGYTGELFCLPLSQLTGHDDPNALHKALYEQCNRSLATLKTDFSAAMLAALARAIPSGDEQEQGEHEPANIYPIGEPLFYPLLTNMLDDGHVSPDSYETLTRHAKQIDARLMSLLPDAAHRQHIAEGVSNAFSTYLDALLRLLASDELLASHTRRAIAQLTRELKAARVSCVGNITQVLASLAKEQKVKISAVQRTTCLQDIANSLNLIGYTLTHDAPTGRRQGEHEQLPTPDDTPTPTTRQGEQIAPDSDSENESGPIDFTSRRQSADMVRKNKQLQEDYGYVRNASGLHMQKPDADGDMQLQIIARGHVDVSIRREVLSVPDVVTNKPESRGVVLLTQLASLDRTHTQTLEIYHSDMYAKQPQFIEQIQAIKVPHKRKHADFIDAIEAIGILAPIEHRYNATGLVKIEDGYALLHLRGGAITEHGIDEQYQVQLPLHMQGKVTALKYGWERVSNPQEAVQDFHTLLRLLDIAPGCSGYGPMLLGVGAYTPLSQLSDTAGVWAIIHGLTGSMKSATARLMLQAFTGTHGRQETSTVNLREEASTPFAVEQVLYYLAGMFALLDDALKANSVTMKTIEKFWTLASIIGSHTVERQGAKRGKWGQGEGGLGFSPYPRGSGVITTEVLPEAEKHASDLARFAVVSLDGVSRVDMALLSELQSSENARAMNRAMGSYIMHLLAHMQSELDALPTYREQYEQTEGHYRVAATYAKLEVGLHALLSYGVSIRAISEQEQQSLMARCHTELLALSAQQNLMMGVEEGQATTNDTVHIFYELLYKALREHKLYATDAAYRLVEVKESDEEGNFVTVRVERLLQPPLFLSDDTQEITDATPDVWGWDWDEHNRVYKKSSGGLEAGVLKFDGQFLTLHVYTQDFDKVLYPALVKLATAQETPLSGLAELKSKLRERAKITVTKPTNLHGRNSRTGSTYIIDVTPARIDDTCSPTPTDTPPDVESSPRQGEQIAPDVDVESSPRQDMIPARPQSDAARVARAGEQVREQVQAWYSAFVASDGCTLRVREDGRIGIGVPADMPDSEYDMIADYVETHAAYLLALLQVPTTGEQEQGRQDTQSDTARASNNAPTGEQQRAHGRADHRQGEQQTHQPHHTVYVDIATGAALVDDGTPLQVAPDSTLSTIITALEQVTACNRLYVCGKIPTNFDAWLCDAGMFATYTTHKHGHYFDSKDATNSLARYTHRATGEKLEIRSLSSWFGDTPISPAMARDAMALLNQYLHATFTEKATAWGTPALTFKELFDLLNRLNGKTYMPLPDEIRSLIRSTSGQGRIEMLTLPRVERVGELHYYDGIFTYAALTWGMPTELAAHDNRNEYAGKTPARYRIRYTVPTDWQHIGLFMTPKGKDAWVYPGKESAGTTFETWADGAELDVLRDVYGTVEQGLEAWHITILERIVFKPEKESSMSKPLDALSQRLIKMRDKVDADARQDAARAALYALVRGMIRNILLHGIGSFNRVNRDKTYILTPDDDAPDGFTTRRDIDNELVAYSVPQRNDTYSQGLEHPEWCALVWARCRARMTRAALSLPREQVIAMRTDALVCTAQQPQWDSNTKVGTLRPKWHISKALKAPHTFDELDALIKKHIK